MKEELHGPTMKEASGKHGNTDMFSASDVAQAYGSNPRTTNNRSSTLSEALRALQNLRRVSQERINLQVEVWVYG